jgi:putative two-component system response regulator
MTRSLTAELAVSAGRIVIADDLPASLDLFERLLQQDDHVVLRARDGEEALALAAVADPDLVLVDVMMPGLNGFEVCRRLKGDPRTRLIPVVLITALQDTADRVKGINAGADDFLSKPVNAPELRARVHSLLRIKRYTDDLDSAEATVLSLARTIEARDQYTDGHCRRLASYALGFGRSLGLSDTELAALVRGGVLHDIGKVGIPDAILLKAGPLTPAERDQMQQHTVIGDHLCGSLRSLRAVRPIVRHHHEHFDGSGYPDGLRGDEIPLVAQVMSVVDVFDALTTTRPYRQPMTVAEACDALEEEAARGWRHPDLVKAFIALVADRGLAMSPTKEGWPDVVDSGSGR